MAEHSHRAERKAEGERILRGFLGMAQDYETDHVQRQLKEAEEDRDVCERRQRVALTHVLLDPKLYRDFAGTRIIDTRKAGALDRAADRAMRSVDSEARRLEKALVPPVGRVDEPEVKRT